MTGPRTAVLVGNPKPGSRTLSAAVSLARRVTGTDADLVVDLAEVGPGLLAWGDPTVAGLVDRISSADLLVVASPTYTQAWAVRRGARRAIGVSSACRASDKRTRSHISQ